LDEYFLGRDFSENIHSFLSTRTVNKFMVLVLGCWISDNVTVSEAKSFLKVPEGKPEVK